MSEQRIQALRRQVRADPDDWGAHLRLIDCLRLAQQPFLEEALKAADKGLPLGPEGLERAWFEPYWRPVAAKQGRHQVQLKLGPFASLAGQAYRGLELQGADLRFADFSDCQLLSPVWTGCRLYKTSFRRARVENSQSTQALFLSCDWREVDAENSHWRGVQWRDCHWRRSSLRQAVLVHCSVVDCNFERVTFESAEFIYSRAHSTDLSEALLIECNLRGLIADIDTTWPEGFDMEAAGIQLLI